MESIKTKTGSSFRESIGQFQRRPCYNPVILDNASSSLLKSPNTRSPPCYLTEILFYFSDRDETINGRNQRVGLSQQILVSSVYTCLVLDIKRREKI